MDGGGSQSKSKTESHQQAGTLRNLRKKPVCEVKKEHRKQRKGVNGRQHERGAGREQTVQRTDRTELVS